MCMTPYLCIFTRATRVSWHRGSCLPFRGHIVQDSRCDRIAIFINRRRCCPLFFSVSYIFFSRITTWHCENTIYIQGSNSDYWFHTSFIKKLHFILNKSVFFRRKSKFSQKIEIFKENWENSLGKLWDQTPNLSSVEEIVWFPWFFEESSANTF